MTLDEAIKVNEETRHRQLMRGEVEHAEATKLGIEALRRIKEQRDYRFSHMNRPLPGETE